MKFVSVFEEVLGKVLVILLGEVLNSDEFVEVDPRGLISSLY